jgi:RNA polymerase sigma factor (sigma-70 family)
LTPSKAAAAVVPTLERLIELVGLGQRAAFAALYEATSAQLFGVVLRINPDRAQAEEVLQEVYVNVWRSAAGYEAARAQPMTWLSSIARNGAIDSLRRARARGQGMNVSLTASTDDDADDPAERLVSDGPGAVELLQQAAEARAVTRCIDGLSAEQKQCVALAYYQGLSHSEIADQLVEPLGTVKSWLRRALLALKECLTHAAPQRPGR